MYGLPCGPAEPEHADGYAESSDKCWWQAVLWLQLALVVEFGLCVLVHVPKERRNSDHHSNKDTDVCESLCAEGETVYTDEDDRKAFEPEIQLLSSQQN